MRKPAFGHQIVRFDGGLDVVLMDTNRDSHQHLLRAFDHFAVDLKQVGPLECFEAKIVVTVRVRESEDDRSWWPMMVVI